MEKEQTYKMDNSASQDSNSFVILGNNDAESHSDPDISKARERTFNKELSNLVDKIRSNEPQDANENRPEEIITAEDGDDIDEKKQKLLRKYHELYYKAINLAGIENINKEFNPFDFYAASSGDDIINYITHEMNSLSLPEYALLVYDFTKNCLANRANYIKNIDGENLIISVSEDLFTEVSKNDFVLMDRQTILNNLYLKKRFISKKGESYNDSLLFISLGKLFSDFYESAELSESIRPELIRPGLIHGNSIYPVMIIRLSAGISALQIKEIYTKIRDKLTISFLLLHKSILLESYKENTVAFKESLENLDYAYLKYNINNDCLCAVIKIKFYKNIETLFIFNFLYVKLKNKLAGLAYVSRFEKDKIIVFTRKSQKKAIDEILDDIKKYYNGYFQVELFFSEASDNAKMNLINKIKKYIVK